MQPAEVAEREGVAGLGLIGWAVGEREVPRRVLVPTVGLEEGVLLSSVWLDVGPSAADRVLVRVDQLPSLGDTALVDPVGGHAFSLPNAGVGITLGQSVSTAAPQVGQR